MSKTKRAKVVRAWLVERRADGKVWYIGLRLESARQALKNARLFRTGKWSLRPLYDLTGTLPRKKGAKK